MVERKGQESALFLLLRAAAAFREDIEAVIATEPRVPDVLRRLHGGQRRLLTLIPPAGARGTDLAARAGITPQSLGEFAAGLAEVGLVAASVDPGDRRARLWRLTPDGERAARAALEVIASVESAWRDMLGDRDYERLIATLRRVGAHHQSVDRLA
jgi:DNA-binding MarR family transcriptional regulator